jgi:hypothetical protein
MYGTIPDVVISKPPRNNQFRVVVALGVGVLIGALGTASMLFPVATKITPAPTPAPRAGPILAAMEGDDLLGPRWSSTLNPTADLTTRSTRRASVKNGSPGNAKDISPTCAP